MKNRISEAVARPVRTAGQGTVAWLVTEGIDSFLVDLDERQYGVAVGLLTVAFSFVQNVVENGWGKALLRDLPDEGAPVADTDDTPPAV